MPRGVIATATSKPESPALTNPYPASLKPVEITFTTGHLDVCQHSGR